LLLEIIPFLPLTFFSHPLTKSSSSLCVNFVVPLPSSLSSLKDFPPPHAFPSSRPSPLASPFFFRMTFRGTFRFVLGRPLVGFSPGLLNRHRFVPPHFLGAPCVFDVRTFSLHLGSVSLNLRPTSHFLAASLLNPPARLSEDWDLADSPPPALSYPHLLSGGADLCNSTKVLWCSPKGG